MNPKLEMIFFDHKYHSPLYKKKENVHMHILTQKVIYDPTDISPQATWRVKAQGLEKNKNKDDEKK